MSENVGMKHKRKHKMAFPIGLLVIVLAVLGAISAVTWGAEKIENLTNKTAQKLEYGSFLTEVVMNDPDPFDDVSRANQAQLIDISIWKLLEDKNDPDKYDLYEGEVTGRLVPQEDVEKSFKDLFGTDVKIKHEASVNSAYSFFYDASKKAYIIPITGVKPAYTPKVMSIDKKGSSVALTVGYLNAEDWLQNDKGDFIEPAPSKFMKITLRESGDKYYISAIQATDAADVIEGSTAMKLPELTTTPPETEATKKTETSATQTAKAQ